MVNGGMVNCGQETVRKLVYSQAGQTSASMNEWEASAWSWYIAIKAGIHREGASKNPAVIYCVNILG